MGLFSNSKKLLSTDFLRGATDYHSHILPSVDDGFASLSKSLRALRFFESLGLKKLWLTPHIMEDYPNLPSRLRSDFEALKEAYTGNLQLALGAENMLDPLFEKRLERDELLTVGESGTHLLVETSYFNPPSNFKAIFDDINSAGYDILLAHPERYRYMKEEDYLELRDKGVKFQINYGSLVGFYGDTAKAKAEWLLKNGHVDVFGSDAHSLRYVMGQLEEKVSSHIARLLRSLPAPNL